ncbi:MAG: PspA/IM30 family protein [Spirochaetota bacterium]
MADQFDLSGMSSREAKDYVLQYLKALQEIRRRKDSRQADFQTWERRARLAKEQDRPELQAEALARCRELADEFDSLTEQEKSLQNDVDELKRRLATHTETTVNTSALLRNLESVVGDSHQADKAIDDLEVESELERLKQQAAQEGAFGDAGDEAGTGSAGSGDEAGTGSAGEAEPRSDGT